MTSTTLQRLPAIDDSSSTSRYPLPDDIRAQFKGLSPYSVLERAAVLMEKYQRNIDELQAQKREIAEMRNAAALIHIKLPTEILMQILRSVHPETPRAIRITHVSRLWRSLAQSIPEFWEDLLRSPDYLLFDAPRWLSLILEMLARSEPRMVGLSLCGECLPLLSELSDHFTRLTHIYIECLDEKTHRLSALFDFYFPSLERLTIWLIPHSHSDSPEGRISQARFPRLRSVLSNCTLIAQFCAAPALRSLIVEDPSSRGPAHERCCYFPTFAAFHEILRKSPNLEELQVHWCLPDTEDVDIDDDPIVDLPHLRSCTISDIAPRGRVVLEHITFSLTTVLSLWAEQSPNITYVLPEEASVDLPITSVDRVTIERDNASRLEGPIISAYAGDQERLVIRQTDHYDWGCAESWVVPGAIRGIAHAALGFAAVTTLEIHWETFHFRPSEVDWLFVLKAYAALRTLKIRWRHMKPLFSALAVEDTVVGLETLDVTTEVEVHQAMPSALEARALRGSRLTDLSYRLLVGGLVLPETPVMPQEYLDRLKVVVTNVTTEFVQSSHIAEDDQ